MGAGTGSEINSEESTNHFSPCLLSTFVPPIVPRRRRFLRAATDMPSCMIHGAISGESNTFYGAYFAPLTKFAVLDIDEKSKYHNAQELQRLNEILSLCGLAKIVLYQSSRSTGWHLYIPFDDAVDSKDLEAALKVLLRRFGYDLQGEQLEIFPSCNALRLPLQPGFAWLDGTGKRLRMREELTTDQAVDFFFFYTTWKKMPTIGIRLET